MSGAKQEKWDIYVTLVGSSDVRRLTSDPAEDWHPAWSPDGRQIAFLREQPEGSTIQLVSVLGGADRRVGDFRGADSVGWSPDGRWLIAGRAGEGDVGGPPRGIFVLPMDGGNPRALIASSAGVADYLPAISPDGRRLAYVSCTRAPAAGIPIWSRCEIRLVELDGARVTSAPRRLTKQIPFIGSMSWARDGSALVYDAEEEAASLQSLWRVGVDGTRSPERIEIAGMNAFSPVTALSRDRLAFSQGSSNSDIYRFQLGSPVQLLIGSTFEEVEPRLSPDDRRLVFGSRRSGDVMDIWMAEADGSGVRQVTRGPGRVQGSPYWSPDGRRIVFDSLGADYHWHVWTVDADGGTPRRLTTEAGDENVPTWSHDGRYIYFWADRGSGRDTWRVAEIGGTAERVTRGGSGPFACETPDGKSLVYQPKDADSPLMALSLAGGETRPLVACARNSAFWCATRGIYYVPCNAGSNPVVHLLDSRTGRSQGLGTLEGVGERPLGLSVSSDGRTIIYARPIASGSDLMLIENFR